MKAAYIIALAAPLLLSACADQPEPVADAEPFALVGARMGDAYGLFAIEEADPAAAIELRFSAQPDPTSAGEEIALEETGGADVACSIACDGTGLRLMPRQRLRSYASYLLVVGDALRSADGRSIATGKTIRISTAAHAADSTGRMDDDELLDLVQERTFRYFWDFGHPSSGMARERSTSGDIVTSGGTGFGLLAMIVAAERGFVGRDEAADRIGRIVGFLATEADRFHGAFPHWLDGTTGAAIPFSADDNGADLVETALLMQGLLAVRAYFDGTDERERTLRDRITELWEAVEWDFFTKEGCESQLYWHWSPDLGWKIGLPVTGWNEALIVYVLAAASPTHPIDRTVYDEGWARNGAMRNGASYYGTTLPLGEPMGGPLFWAHYSFAGLDPRDLADTYADYWQQNTAHARINYLYCIDNPAGYRGYGADCWGLTASDGPDGYGAWSPTNDTGVIAPTAALASMPYTPDESMAALRHFYYGLGDRLWGEYGFYDAFDLTDGWFSTEYLAIDQGPVVAMIENHRTGLLWELFMSDADVRRGVAALGFRTTAHPAPDDTTYKQKPEIR